MSEVLIHIGYHKTGTTWLQNNLFINNNETFHPLSVHQKGKSTLARCFIINRQGQLLNSFQSYKPHIVSAIKATINANPKPKDKIFVVSHERLSGTPHSGGFDASVISERIKNVLPNAKIFIVIREQKSKILSDYLQYLSIGGNFSLKKYMTTPYDGKIPFFSSSYYNYYHLILKYQQLFGKDHVLVLPYELFQKDKNKFIQSLASFMGKEIKIDPASFNDYENKTTNHFISFYFKWLNIFIHSTSVNHYSRFKSKLGSRLIEQVLHVLKKITPHSFDKKTKLKLSNEINDIVGNSYSNSNKKINELIKIDLSEYGYF